MAAQRHVQDTVVEVNQLRCISTTGDSSTTDIPTLIARLNPVTFANGLVCLTELTVAILGDYYMVLVDHTEGAKRPDFSQIMECYAILVGTKNRYLDKRHCSISSAIDTSVVGSSVFDIVYNNPERPTINPATQPTDEQKPVLLAFCKNAVVKLHRSETIKLVIDLKGMYLQGISVTDYMDEFQDQLAIYSAYMTTMPCHILLIFRGHSYQQNRIRALVDNVDHFRWSPDGNIPITCAQADDPNMVPNMVKADNRLYYTFEVASD